MANAKNYVRCACCGKKIYENSNYILALHEDDTDAIVPICDKNCLVEYTEYVKLDFDDMEYYGWEWDSDTDLEEEKQNLLDDIEYHQNRLARLQQKLKNLEA